MFGISKRSHAIHPETRRRSLTLDENCNVAFTNTADDTGPFVSEQHHAPNINEFEGNSGQFRTDWHQLEANYMLDLESSSVNSVLIPPNPSSSLDEISNEYSLQHIPIANQSPAQQQGHHHTGPEQWVSPTSTVLAGMVPAPEPIQSQYNDSYIPVNPTIPGLEPTDAPHHQFCALLIERNVNPYEFISFMLTHRHLDADRLREILTSLAGRHVPSRRRRTIPREARICSECGTRETKQWRRDPGTKADLCNSCGQRAYRTRMG
ncbi:hypothetical protein R3P38DRAFT_3377679 [Favolaschia claudopus]|uniref:GATA-type domain-containing protein n=1 Tax=Favolaschia claudopus TaxID=2862362 RepID=A0AAV9ZAY8_9AGAR